MIEERAISVQGQAAGVLRDRLLQLDAGSCRHALAGQVRVIEVKCTPHPGRAHTGRGGPEQSETLALATDLVDLEADVIALIFQHRWTIGTIICMLKRHFGCALRARSYHSQNQEIRLRILTPDLGILLRPLCHGMSPQVRACSIQGTSFSTCGIMVC